MLNKTGECALRSLVHLARQGVGVPILCRDIASAIGAPEPCVAGVLRVLAKRGILESLKGKGGGFALRPGAEDLSAWDILRVVATGAESRMTCILGQNPCNELSLCPLHGPWQELWQRKESLLRDCSIARLAAVG